MVFSELHLGILVFLAVGVLMAGGALTFAFFLSPRSRNRQIGTPYECGMPPMQDAWIRFHINYAVYALIFLAFEVDVLYLFPVALAWEEAGGLSAFLKVFAFLFVLGAAIVFFHAKGVFRWQGKI